MRLIAAGALASMLLGGCLRAEVNRCQNGAICQQEQACTEQPIAADPAMQHPLCGIPELVDQCYGAHRNEFASCDFSSSLKGTCHFGICDVCAPSLAGCASSWDPMESNTGENLKGIWVRNESDAIAIGDSGAVIRYDGFSWKHDIESENAIATLLGGSPSLVGIVGFDQPRELFVLAAGIHVLRYANSTWTDISLPADKAPTAIWGSAPTNIVTVGLYGEIWRFDGTSWMVMVPSNMASTVTYFGVGGSGPSDIYAVGKDGASLGNALKADGTIHRFDGSSWSSMRAVADQVLQGVWASGPGAVFASGIIDSSSAISSYDGSSWTDYPGAAGTGVSIWGTGPSDVFVAGSKGIYHFDGMGWGDASPMIDVSAINGSSPTNVFAVGAAGKIWRYAVPTN